MFHTLTIRQAPLPALAPRPGFLGVRTSDAGNLLRAVADQVITDLHDLETRIAGAERGRDLSPEAIGYGRGVDEHVDLIYSVAAIASLAEYRRGEPEGAHRLPLAVDVADVRARLDRIRARLIDLAPTVPGYLRGRRYRPEFARALACLYLALDATPEDRADLNVVFRTFAPVSQRSQDPQGDAQAYAEEVDEAGGVGSDV